MSVEKKELRTAIRQLNKQYLTPPYYEEASRAICTALKGHSWWQEARRIALYHALPDEPDLSSLLAEYAQSKELFLPRVEGAEIMAFFPYDGEKELSIGSYGIAEPSHKPQSAVAPSSLDLIIVPGVAFTQEGVRMGRGKGYYDRFLPHTQAKLIGVTFRYRLLTEIPHEAWDFRMHHVLTD